MVRRSFRSFTRNSRTKTPFGTLRALSLDEARKQAYLPLIGWVSYRRSRFIEGKAKNVTVCREADGWYISIQTEREAEDPVHPKAGVEVGIDVGVVHAVTLSDDAPLIEPLNAFRRNQQKLAHAQRKLKRMTKFGRNWRKQQQKIALLHHRIAESRRDHLRKAAREICKNHAVVYREDLKIQNMTKSDKETVEEPGKNVKQKSGLNKAILDQGWGTLFRMFDQYMRSMPYRRPTRLELVRTAAACRQPTGRRRRSFDAKSAGTCTTRTVWARSTFSGAGTP